jgi:hypothetical protein
MCAGPEPSLPKVTGVPKGCDVFDVLQYCGSMTSVPKGDGPQGLDGASLRSDGAAATERAGGGAVGGPRGGGAEAVSFRCGDGTAVVGEL